VPRHTTRAGPAAFPGLVGDGAEDHRPDKGDDKGADADQRVTDRERGLGKAGPGLSRAADRAQRVMANDHGRDVHDRRENQAEEPTRWFPAAPQDSPRAWRRRSPQVSQRAGARTTRAAAEASWRAYGDGLADGDADTRGSGARCFGAGSGSIRRGFSHCAGADRSSLGSSEGSVSGTSSPP